MNARAAGLCGVALAVAAAAAQEQPAAAAAAPAPFAARVQALCRAVSPQAIEQTVRTLVAFGTRHVFSATDDDARGTGAARRWLEQQFRDMATASGGRLQVAFDRGTGAVARAGMPAEIAICNVVAVLPGTTDAARVYVVGGHYDSRNGDGTDGKRDAPGADDDASGTAVALEACRALCGQEWPATLIFCAFDGEEQGLVGSKHYADGLVAADTAVDGMIACDIVGNTLGMDGVRRRDHVRCFSYAPTGNDSSGRSLARALVRAARDHVPGFAAQLVYRGDRYGRGGDHRSFFEAGFPAVRLTEPREDFSRQHQDVKERDGAPYGDLPAFVDFAYAADVARVVIATLAELAAAPPPPLVTAARGALGAYDTELDLEVPAGVPQIEVVWRQTTAPDWEGALRLRVDELRPGARGRRTAMLPGICLDDVVVGACCVGADGARSRVATPPDPDRMAQRGASGDKR